MDIWNPVMKKWMNPSDRSGMYINNSSARKSNEPSERISYKYPYLSEYQLPLLSMILFEFEARDWVSRARARSLMNKSRWWQAFPHWFAYTYRFISAFCLQRSFATHLSPHFAFPIRILYSRLFIIRVRWFVSLVSKYVILFRDLSFSRTRGRRSGVHRFYPRSELCACKLFVRIATVC